MGFRLNYILILFALSVSDLTIHRLAMYYVYTVKNGIKATLQDFTVMFSVFKYH